MGIIIDVKNLIKGRETEYRLRQLNEFQNNLLKKELTKPLLFHGTKLDRVKSILQTGEIRSGRPYAYTNIFATPPENVYWSVNGFADMRPDLHITAGAVFAVLAKSPQEYDDARQTFEMEKINFKKDPKRLYAVISTPNNLEYIEKWAKQSDIITPTICDYDEFLRTL